MSAACILHKVWLSRERVGELCELYGHAAPATPPPPSIDLRGCRYHRTVRVGNGALGERALPEEVTP
jgi:hypothetical protein